MSSRRRVWIWGSVLVGGFAVAGLGAFLVTSGLERADKLASAIGLFVALAGLGMSGYGAASTRRNSAAAVRQSVSGATVGGSVTQVGDVRGSVRLGRHASVPAPTAGLVGSDGVASLTEPIPLATSVEPGQQVTRSQVCGQVWQVDRVGGDVEVDE